MSNNCKRHPQKSPIAPCSLRPRRSRHGKDLSEVYVVRSNRRLVLNEKTKQYEVRCTVRPMPAEEIEMARTKPRALHSTNNYGKTNTPEGAQRMKQPKGASPQGQGGR